MTLYSPTQESSFASKYLAKEIVVNKSIIPYWTGSRQLNKTELEKIPEGNVTYVVEACKSFSPCKRDAINHLGDRIGTLSCDRVFVQGAEIAHNPCLGNFGWF